MNQGTERAVVHFVMNAVAGDRWTPGRHETGGVPPMPPATIFLSLLPRGWRDREKENRSAMWCPGEGMEIGRFGGVELFMLVCHVVIWILHDG